MARRPALRMRLAPSFPARIQNSDGIGVARSGGAVTIRQDWSGIQRDATPDDPENYDFLLGKEDGSLVRLSATELGALRPIASLPEAEAGVDNNTTMTPLRTSQQIDARLADHAVAVGGADNSAIMTPLGVNQYVSAQLSDQPTAEAGSNNTKTMTPLRTKQQVDARLADDTTPDTDDEKLSTPEDVVRRIVTNGVGADYATVAEVATVAIPAGRKTVALAGEDAAGDGRGGTYVESLTPPGPTDMKSVTDLNGRHFIFFKPKHEKLSPFQFGAKGEGSGSISDHDDKPALDKMFAAYRALTQAAGQNYNTVVDIDLEGGGFTLSGPGNATGLTAWSGTISNGMLFGRGAGKPILDLCGSRGYRLENTRFVGMKDSMPSSAFQAARTTANGFCDNTSFCDVSTVGYFATAAMHMYAAETFNADHLTLFNYNHDAHVVILEGYDAHPITSDFATVLTGGRSFINNRFYADVRYLPVGTNISVINAVVGGSNAVFTVAAGHAWQAGDKIVFAGVGGMPLLARVIGTVLSVAGNDITTDVNTSGLGSFTAGGNMIRAQTRSTMYLARAEEMDARLTYLAGYGYPPLTLAFPDAGFARMERLVLPSLYEGSGIESNVIIDGGSTGSTKRIFGMELEAYNSNASVSLINNPGTQVVDIIAPKIKSVDPLYTAKLALPLNKFAMRDADIVFGTLADVGTIGSTQLGYSAFNGKINALNDGRTHMINLDYDTHLAQTTAVVLSSGSGAPGSYSGNIKTTKIGKRVFVSGEEIVIATLSPSSGTVYVLLPYAPDGTPAYGNGRNFHTGAILSVEWLPGQGYGNYARVRTANNGPAITADGQRFDFSFSYLTT